VCTCISILGTGPANAGRARARAYVGLLDVPPLPPRLGMLGPPPPSTLVSHDGGDGQSMLMLIGCVMKSTMWFQMLRAIEAIEFHDLSALFLTESHVEEAVRRSHAQAGRMAASTAGHSLA
jgi:hypothetical protein